MNVAEKLQCPKCKGYLIDKRCVKCNLLFNNSHMHRMWLEQFKEVYDIDKEVGGKE